MKYTKPQIKFIHEHYKGISSMELADMFNKEFGTDRAPESINAFKGHHGLKSGWNNHFKKGNIPWNNGTKGQGVSKKNKGSFKPKSIGSIRTHKRTGYKWIKTADGWTPYMQYMYEKYHGVKIGDDEAIRLLDGDKNNYSKENLIKITKREAAFVNKNSYLFDNAEMNQAGINIAKVKLKLKDLNSKSNVKKQ